MKAIRTLKLGTVCSDRATELTGTLTHWLIDMSGYVSYFFQPRGLDEEGQPMLSLHLCAERLEVQEEDWEDVEVPFEILGTKVEDMASGFSGMAISFMRHINGCFHVYIQPAGLIPGKNKVIERTDFDLRGCRGDMIPVLLEEDKKESKKKNPSPARCICAVDPPQPKSFPSF